jgi:FlaA1/EpsC-like NDP-sugar epimerase
MFRLEKIFQKDDNLYINISILLKSFLVFLSIYAFSILEFNSIYDLFNFDIYKKSKFFFISLYFPIFYLLFSFILRATKKRYVVHLLSFFLNDIIPLIVAIPLILYIFFIFKINYIIDISNIYLLVFIIFNLFITRKILDTYYRNLMDNNVIQRNIMLVGSLESIQKILRTKNDKINIYKCCLINSNDKKALENARISLKIPVFTDRAEMRIIFEYHEL